MEPNLNDKKFCLHLEFLNLFFKIYYHVEPPPPLIAQKRSEFLVEVTLRPFGDLVLVPSAFVVTKLPSAETRSTSTI